MISVSFVHFPTFLSFVDDRMNERNKEKGMEGRKKGREEEKKQKRNILNFSQGNFRAWIHMKVLT